MTPKLGMKIPEAAEAAGVTERTIRAWISQGWLKAKRQSRNKNGDPTGQFVITVRALEDCLDNLPDG